MPPAGSSRPAHRITSDGLVDPAGIFARLQERIAAVSGRRGTRALYLVVAEDHRSVDTCRQTRPGQRRDRLPTSQRPSTGMLVDSATRARNGPRVRAVIDDRSRGATWRTSATTVAAPLAVLGG